MSSFQRQPQPKREPPVLVEGKITRITSQKRNQNRASLYIDGKFAFGIMQGVILEFGLHSGKFVTVETQKLILESSYFMAAKAVALEYIGYRLRSEKEVRTKLFKKDFPPAIVERTIARLLDLKYINDERYAEAFSREKLKINRYGRRRIRRDLKTKGIDPELITKALDELEEKDAVDAARHVALRRWKRLRNTPDPYKQYKKIYDLLARRGFNSDITRAIMSEIKTEHPSLQPPSSRAMKKASKTKAALSLEQALELARKRWGQLERLEPNAFKRSQKLKDFLRRKSVDFDMISSIQETLAAEQEAEEQEAAEAIAELDPKEAERLAEEAEAEQFDDMVAQAQRRWPRVQRLEKNKRKQRQKLQDFLRRRGFNYDMISRLFDEDLLEDI